MNPTVPLRNRGGVGVGFTRGPLGLAPPPSLPRELAAGPARPRGLQAVNGIQASSRFRWWTPPPSTAERA